MSFAVERGSPTKAQLYLDTILDALVAETGREEDRYCLAKVIFKCLRDNPDDIRQIDGSTDETYTNRQMLEKSIKTALALKAAGLKPGDKFFIIGRNYLELSAVYYGSMFAGVIAFPLHIGITVYELKHYFGLVAPLMVFTDLNHLTAVEQALLETNSKCQVILFGQQNTSVRKTFSEFIAGFDENIQDFWPTHTDRNSTVILLSTSGSTGLPKAIMNTNKGLVAQLPSMWFEHDTFPKPTSLYLCTNNSQWNTFTIAMTTTPVYGVQLLTSTENITADHLKSMLRKYRITCSLWSTVLAQSVLQESVLQPDDLCSMETMWLGGSAVTEHLLNMVKVMGVHKEIIIWMIRTDRLLHLTIDPSIERKPLKMWVVALHYQNMNEYRAAPPTTNVLPGYGLTETHGGVIISKREVKAMVLGAVMNITLFKIIDKEENTLGPNQPGELCLKSDNCITTGYVNDKESYDECFTKDGWFKTGDRVYMNEQEEIIYVERIKFVFKYNNQHVSPSEIEGVICSVEGVQMAAVCDSKKGPAALVAVKSGFEVDAQVIHDTVKGLLIDYKRLRGGIAFVPSVPVNPNGKIDRTKVKNMFQEIPAESIIYMTTDV